MLRFGTASKRFLISVLKTRTKILISRHHQNTLSAISRPMSSNVQKPESEWRAILSPEQVSPLSLDQIGQLLKVHFSSFLVQSSSSEGN